ncbi:TIGR01777 family oxidoreductase [Marinilabilia salmonicolor]|uniref:TIGR01777 family oxidoreductase n=1 Tax=Marinilabilia salmonicolor TaxID=989 RepID=UPI001F46A65A|nr:TIGR01777 family oxidoreductase [Marinilabilia salmonicolor]
MCYRNRARDFRQDISYLQDKLTGVDVLVHLAGAPILKRWTKKWKETILRSRTETTGKLVEAMNGMTQSPSVFVSASAVGIYDTFEVHDEYSTEYADDFLSLVCQKWEAEAMQVDTSKIRLAVIRLGMVLSSEGGALKQMALPFKMGVGGRIGDGMQPMPYIHIDDLTAGVEWIINHDDQRGVFNMVAPQMVSNAEFTAALSAVLNRPAFFVIPEFALRLLYGGAASVITEGQKVVPHRLPDSGFQYRYPDIRLALGDLLKK